jgi:hypothetical protein
MRGASVVASDVAGDAGDAGDVALLSITSIVEMGMVASMGSSTSIDGRGTWDVT